LLEQHVGRQKQNQISAEKQRHVSGQHNCGRRDPQNAGASVRRVRESAFLSTQQNPGERFLPVMGSLDFTERTAVKNSQGAAVKRVALMQIDKFSCPATEHNERCWQESAGAFCIPEVKKPCESTKQ
jgi:hypothetical protein